MNKIKIGVLGATGLVGQTIISLLSDHPWFEVSELAASERSAGARYEDVMSSRWHLGTEIPEHVRSLKVKECIPNLDCEIVLSALDSSVAGPIEQRFAESGYAVSSNAKNHRMDADVPLLIPEINADHVGLIRTQQKSRGWKGFIVTDPNCSAIGMCIALKPLLDNFGLEKVMVTTMQAASGAGYPGVPSMDLIDNVVPFINDEEEKLQEEPLKIFGKLASGSIKPLKAKLSAQCNRVAVRYGHTECVSVKLSRSATESQVIKAFEGFRSAAKLPSSPERPIIYANGNARPQPKLDVNAGRGMAVTVGRLRRCEVLDYKFVALSHNLVRGAAGAAILNAELLKAKGYVGR